ncbi:MAG TPA: hypothetical protein VFS97_04530 [Nitrososphaeraceae archaeon]|nr:hypothetical protein [Nitrososphaeraceae archaeon]
MKATIRSKKKIRAFKIVIIQITLFAVIFSTMYNDNFLIIAQISYRGTNASSSLPSNQTDGSIENRLGLNSKDNFKMEGTITPNTNDSVVQGGVISNESMSSVSNLTTSHQDKILSGTWRIDVVNGNVEYFKSNMTVTTPIGTDMHDHLIEFKSDDPDIMLLPNNTAIISLNPATVEIAALNFSQNDKNVTSISRADGNITFSGVADILTNGVIEWRAIPTSVSIFDENVINIKLNSKAVNNHFSEKPIYGSVDSVEPIIVIQNATAE